MRRKYCVLLPAAGRRTQYFLLIFTKPGRSLFAEPCTVFLCNHAPSVSPATWTGDTQPLVHTVNNWPTERLTRLFCRSELMKDARPALSRRLHLPCLLSRPPSNLSSCCVSGEFSLICNSDFIVFPRSPVARRLFALSLLRRFRFGNSLPAGLPPLSLSLFLSFLPV